MLNLIHLQRILSEIFSLATPAKSTHNGTLSQKYTAVTPNGLNWLFYCPNSDDLAIPPYFNHDTAPKGVLMRFPLMVWLILQNKPIGEYAKRLLYIPRVRPHHPTLGLSTQNYTGAFPC